MGDSPKAADSPFKHFGASKNPKDLKPMRIARVNTELILTKKNVCTITDKTDFNNAHIIINDIIRKTRKRANEYKADFKQLQINPEIQRSLHESGVTFEVRLYVAETKGNSQMTKCLSQLLTDKDRKDLLKKKEAQKLFVLFFYRNIENGTKKNSFIPEMFVLTSGSAWTILSDPEKNYVDTNFPKRVERRTLQFKFELVKSEKESGNIIKESLMARSGHKIEFSVWDFMDKLVKSRRRQLRENSSLYSEYFKDAFLTKRGNKFPAKFEISTTTLTILKCLNLFQLGLILDHFSNICLKKPTYLVKDTNQTKGESEQREEEVDGEKFEMHNYIAKVSDETIINRLDAALHDTLEKSMKGNKSCIYLTHRLLSQWQVASEITLAARKSTDTQERATRRNRRCLNKESPWSSPPSLDAVMELLRNEFNGEYHKGWLDNEDALIKFKNGQGEPLRNFLFTRIEVEFAGAYMCYYGSWMEMSAHYLYTIEKDFVHLLAKTILKRNELPWLLPWKNPLKTSNKGNKKCFDCTGNGKREKCTEYDIEKWQNHFKNTCCRNEPFNQICIEAEKLRQKEVLISDYDTLKEKSLEEKAGHLYHHLECSLNESEYNNVHTLFDKICQNYNHKMTIIVCDNIEPHNIELCDILMFNDEITYLVHVKKEFLLKSIRVVCSQIRNAADQIYHDQYCGTGLIKRYWEELTRSNRLESMSVREFQDLFKLNRKIVFVLACRDTRQRCDFTDDVPNQDNLGVEMTDTIRNEFKAEYGETIIAKLKEKQYLSKKGKLTNQFILDGKSKEGKAKFVNVMLSSKSVKDENDAKKLHAVLVSGLSKSSSTGAKMEIIRLAQYFKANGKKNFKLRIHSICHDFESTDYKMNDYPAANAIDDSSDDEKGIDDEHDENFPSLSNEKSRKSENKGNTSSRSIKSSSHKDEAKRYYSSCGKKAKASEKKGFKVVSLYPRRRKNERTKGEVDLRTNDKERKINKVGRTLESTFHKQPPKVVKQQHQLPFEEMLKPAQQNTKEKDPMHEVRAPKRIEERPRTQEEIERRKRAECKRKREEEEIKELKRQSYGKPVVAISSVSESITIKSKNGSDLYREALTAKSWRNNHRLQPKQSKDRVKLFNPIEKNTLNEDVARHNLKINRQTSIGSANTSPQKEASQSSHRASTLKMKKTPKPGDEGRGTVKGGSEITLKTVEKLPTEKTYEYTRYQHQSTNSQTEQNTKTKAKGPIMKPQKLAEERQQTQGIDNRNGEDRKRKRKEEEIIQRKRKPLAQSVEASNTNEKAVKSTKVSQLFNETLTAKTGRNFHALKPYHSAGSVQLIGTKKKTANTLAERKALESRDRNSGQKMGIFPKQGDKGRGTVKGGSEITLKTVEKLPTEKTYEYTRYQHQSTNSQTQQNTNTKAKGPIIKPHKLAEERPQTQGIDNRNGEDRKRKRKEEEIIQRKRKPLAQSVEASTSKEKAVKSTKVSQILNETVTAKTGRKFYALIPNKSAGSVQLIGTKKKTAKKYDVASESETTYRQYSIGSANTLPEMKALESRDGNSVQKIGTFPKQGNKGRATVKGGSENPLKTLEKQTTTKIYEYTHHQLQSTYSQTQQNTKPKAKGPIMKPHKLAEERRRLQGIDNRNREERKQKMKKEEIIQMKSQPLAQSVEASTSKEKDVKSTNVSQILNEIVTAKTGRKFYGLIPNQSTGIVQLIGPKKKTAKKYDVASDSVTTNRSFSKGNANTLPEKKPLDSRDRNSGQKMGMFPKLDFKGRERVEGSTENKVRTVQQLPTDKIRVYTHHQPQSTYSQTERNTKHKAKGPIMKPQKLVEERPHTQGIDHKSREEERKRKRKEEEINQRKRQPLAQSVKASTSKEKAVKSTNESKLSNETVTAKTGNNLNGLKSNQSTSSVKQSSPMKKTALKYDVASASVAINMPSSKGSATTFPDKKALESRFRSSGQKVRISPKPGDKRIALNDEGSVIKSKILKQQRTETGWVLKKHPMGNSVWVRYIN